MDLSLILPSYRSGQIAVASAMRLTSYFARLPLSWELIIVDDGSNDIPDLTSISTNARRLQHGRNRGKGAAVRTGLAAAKGDVRLVTDIDLPYGTRAIAHAYFLIASRQCHLVLGDRRLATSSFIRPRSVTRRIVSSLSTALVATLVTGGFGDTQCGFKAIRGDIADGLLPELRVSGFTFDVELVYLCIQMGLDIKRIPVQQESDGPSSVRPVRDSVAGLLQVLRIVGSRRRLRRVRALMSERLTREFEMALADSEARLAASHRATSDPV